jgi:hypothetical protein
MEDAGFDGVVRRACGERKCNRAREGCDAFFRRDYTKQGILLHGVKLGRETPEDSSDRLKDEPPLTSITNRYSGAAPGSRGLRRTTSCPAEPQEKP